MDSLNYQPSGEEIERALMDLGLPLLGVNIKEEVSEDLAADTAGGAAPATNAGTSSAGAGGEPESGAGADSLASPTRAPPSAARCALCQAPLAQTDGTPKLMECLHSVCEPCLQAKLEEARQPTNRDFLGAERVTVTCPACRLPCQPANMIDQRFVIEKLAADQSPNTGGVSGEQQCNSCEDTEPATSYCVDCAEFICDNCVHAHQRLKITKDHTIKSKEEAVTELQLAQNGPRSAADMYCREHTQERLTLFCETCDRLTCRDCQLQHHRDHKYQFSTEMAAQARASIAALLSEVSYKRVLLGSAMKVIRDRQQLIADKKKALVHDITQTVVKLTNAINTRGKQLVLRLNEVCDGKQRTLSEKKEALQHLAAVTDHTVDFVSAALEHGSDTALLHCKRSVCQHLQRIKSRRADIPNPEIPVRISLQLDKLPDLIRVLSSIGAIVVDGKVDGAGAGGPYQPPAAVSAPPPASAPPAVPPHSAQVALQHVAMHQQYVQSMSPSPGYLSPLLRHSRALTPLRHPHVTSTTHPHHLHGMSEMNLRGLLGAQAQAQAQAVAQAQAQAQQTAARPRLTHNNNMHAAYQHMMGAYPSSMSGSQPRRAHPRTPSPAPAPASAPSPAHHMFHQPAKWHIPQQNTVNGGMESGVSGVPGAGGGADFKITLRQPRQPPAPSVVTSTNPKTPSPSINGGAMELDKVCAESVQDLMATIAKLDSNGVQVVAEAASPAPPVHSSTDPPRRRAPQADPNEDWCAVCMDGGELMCCDKCPKVFHQYCHIPTIEKLPDESETWQCLLCVNFAELAAAGGDAEAPWARQLKLAERLTLELYCQYELSLVFREPVPADNLHYHSKISRPMCLDMIRMKLQPQAPQRYTNLAQFVADCRLLFSNAYQYNPPDSSIYKDAKRLEEFFDAQLLKLLPEYAYWNGEGEPPNKRPRH
ncbi:E3 ubiquitin-protein ligase TRIM33 [Plodia interpunctella]|uniref:E3 ubiquitin-protein ligase TRIM33 n=1 Tax=Plodia interpunctella TaxID=58824 RepID=UPI0023675FFE|nr:E3 ubiquitin-protein ligase TRIM33 [Plodia interpunctella]